MKNKKNSKQIAQLQPFILSLIDFMRKHGYVSDPIPRIRLVQRKQNANPLLVKTGHYSPDDNEIVLFISDRHSKDILRTLAHELIHVQQDHEQRLNGFDAESALVDDPKLRALEGEAFLRGNLALRFWTEQYTHQDK